MHHLALGACHCRNAHCWQSRGRRRPDRMSTRTSAPLEHIATRCCAHAICTARAEGVDRMWCGAAAEMTRARSALKLIFQYVRNLMGFVASSQTHRRYARCTLLDIAAHPRQRAAGGHLEQRRRRGCHRRTASSGSSRASDSGGPACGRRWQRPVEEVMQQLSSRWFEKRPYASFQASFDLRTEAARPLAVRVHAERRLHHALCIVRGQSALSPERRTLARSTAISWEGKAALVARCCRWDLVIASSSLSDIVRRPVTPH